MLREFSKTIMGAKDFCENRKRSTAIPSHTNRTSFTPAGAVTGIGSLPLMSMRSAIQSVAEFSPEIPFWPQLPRLSEREAAIGQGLGILADLDRASQEGYGYQVKARPNRFGAGILHRSSGELTPANAAGFGAFEEALSSGLFKSAIAVKGQIEGPITLSAYLFSPRSAVSVRCRTFCSHSVSCFADDLLADRSPEICRIARAAVCR